MQIGVIANEVIACFKRWFHKRSFIIVSEHKVKHISISGGLQFSLVMMLVACLVWASYSTGNFYAARSVLKERTQALRSVTSEKVQSNFNSVFHVGPASTRHITGDDPEIASLSAPLVTPSALANNKIFARIATLEHKVIELTNTNDAIVQRIRDKTAQRIDELESIIKQTGLSANDLKKKHAEKNLPANDKKGAQGGPYIPDTGLEMWPQANEMFESLDKLAMLKQIMRNLPLGQPIHNAEQQSQFGHRIDPFNGHLAFHAGLDLTGPAGTNTKIHSPADGKVIAAGHNGAYGIAIDIDHGYGIVTRYGHLSSLNVEEGQAVKKGDFIGTMGSTGRSTGPHLHYEVRYHDRPMNPLNFISAGRYVPEE
jgi:murein DD-endopeptidase MepM/ murein hydrolase activator NlpD